jgi:D-arabinose 1-dehydrogenase-like Zn-dependent alcohol dehydrogenase
MTEDRQEVMKLVLEGKIPPEAVTLEELQEVEEILFELIADRSTPFATHETLQ